jgi:hypothetical protein
LPFSIETVHAWAKNSRSVAVPTAETNQQCTVMLVVIGTGTNQLPPYPVFKGSSLPTGRIYKEL